MKKRNHEEANFIDTFCFKHDMDDITHVFYVRILQVWISESNNRLFKR